MTKRAYANRTYGVVEWTYPAWVLMFVYDLNHWSLPLSLQMEFAFGYYQATVLCFAVALVKHSAVKGTAVEDSPHESTRAK